LKCKDQNNENKGYLESIGGAKKVPSKKKKKATSKRPRKQKPKQPPKINL
jgi:hypothetical protein